MKTPQRTYILRISSRYVRTLFRTDLPAWAHYHGLAHTLDVVAACRKIGTDAGLNDRDMEILLTAAWFHDTGYTRIAEGHEAVSVDIASRFLEGNTVPARTIARISGCIMATQIPQRPKTSLERILADADLSSIGMRSFFRQNDLLKREIEERKRIVLDHRAWLRRSHRFLHHHRFHTRYGRTILERGRLANLALLERTLQNAAE